MYENSRNKFINRQSSIKNFLQNASYYISGDKKDAVLAIAEEIKKTGIKTADACHIACAELMGCDYFLTTDYRVLKYHTDKISIMNPIDFLKMLEGD